VTIINVSVRDTGREFIDKRATLSVYIRVKEKEDTSTQTPPSPSYSSAPLPKNPGTLIQDRGAGGTLGDELHSILFVFGSNKLETGRNPLLIARRTDES